MATISWEIFFSPLRAFPGPLAAKFTNIWRAIVAATGHVDRTNIEWHRKHGSAVRIGPNTLSISDHSLIRTIYGTKNAWKKVLSRSIYSLKVVILTKHNQSDMYRPNDVRLNGKRLSNLFNTQDNDWHDKYINPIRKLWTMTALLKMEPLIDDTLSKLTDKLSANFADEPNTGKTCMMDDWLAFCKT